MALGRGALLALLVPPLAQSLHLVSDEAEARAADECPLWCHASKQQWHVKCTYMRCSACPSCGPAGDSTELQGLLAAVPEAEPQALLGGRAAEAGAVADDTLSGRAADVGAIAVVDTLGVRAAEAGAIAEVTTQRSNESVTGVAGEGVEDVVQCPIWCHVSKQYWNVKCSYMRCSNCPMCGPPTSKDSKEAAPEAEPQALLGGRAAEASAVAEVATQRSNQSDTGAAGEGVEDDPQCPLWCSASRQSWSAKCAMGHCSTCPSCGPLASKEAAPEAEPQGLLGGRAAGAGAVADDTLGGRAADVGAIAVVDTLGVRAAEAGAIAEVTTQRSNESDTGVAGEGVEDVAQCPIWCHVSKQYWNVKCSYMRCSNCPMCGPPASKDSKEAAPEAEPQALLGGRAAEAGIVAEVATKRSNQSDTGATGEGVEDDPQCPLWCSASRQSWSAKCAMGHCSTCPSCGQLASKEAAPEAEPQGLLGGRAAGAGAMQRSADITQCPLWCHASKQQWHVKCTYMRCSTCPSCGPAGDSRELQGLLAALPEADSQGVP